MPDHMVTAAFTSEPDATLLPVESRRLKELTDEGIVLRGDGLPAVQKALESLPLYPCMEPPTS